MKDLIDMIGFLFIIGVCYVFLGMPDTYNKPRAAESGPAIYGP